MKTPDGRSCKYYYADFNRGRNRQECRLILRETGSTGWRPADCARYAVPDILWANASENLEIRARVKPGFLGFGRNVDVTTRCKKHSINITDPYGGCEQCAAERPNLADLIVQEDK